MRPWLGRFELPQHPLTEHHEASHSGDRIAERVRDGLGVLLVTVGLAWAVLARDKIGLVIAFAGVTLLELRRPQTENAAGWRWQGADDLLVGVQ